jgi:UDP-glucose-4-epimerase GalE
LVIGGAGYIGSHLCKALAYEGYSPITYDSLETGHRSCIRWGPFIQGNILNKPLLSSTLKQFAPSAVFHLAAYSNARSTQNRAYFRNNVLGTQTVLEAMQQSHICPFIFSSSAAVYGQGSNLQMEENCPALPLSVYGKTKLACEGLVADFCQNMDVPYAILRYFNVAGADPDREIGENHDPETHLIPSLIKILSKPSEHFTLFSHNHPTHDGTAKRDFIHVCDLARAHIDLLKWLHEHKKKIILNLGSGIGHTILDVISSLEAITQKKIPIQIAEQVLEPSCLVADIAKAKKLLDWEPKCSDLTSIIHSALNWHLQ